MMSLDGGMSDQSRWTVPGGPGVRRMAMPPGWPLPTAAADVGLTPDEHLPDTVYETYVTYRVDHDPHSCHGRPRRILRHGQPRGVQGRAHRPRTTWEGGRRAGVG